MIDHRVYSRAAAALVAMPELVQTLEVEMWAATPATDGTHSKPSSKPPAPIGILSDVEEAWSTVTTWARDWQDFTHSTRPLAPTWLIVCGFLGDHWPNMADQHPAADEFADEITHTHRQLSRHLGEGVRAWQPIIGRWACPVIPLDGDSSPSGGPNTTNPPNPTTPRYETVTEAPSACAGVLLEHVEQRVIVCKRCGSSWRADEYERLGAMLGMDPLVNITQAALIAKVHRNTIARWIDTGVLPAKPDMFGNRKIDKRDLVIVVMRQERA